MSVIASFIDIILHLDVHLNAVIQSYGVLTYVLLFLIIFCETGLVVMPFLPGDSLLFAAGAFAAQGSLSVLSLFFMLVIAAIVGDTLNYGIGGFIGKKVYAMNSVWVKKDYLNHAQEFYKKHGKKTIILARFVPIIRTFAPFVAGVGSMEYARFIMYNIVGGVAWVALFIFGGYFFGNIPLVKNNFSLVIFVIIFLSLVPAVQEFVRHRKSR